MSYEYLGRHRVCDLCGREVSDFLGHLTTNHGIRDASDYAAQLEKKHSVDRAADEFHVFVLKLQEKLASGEITIDEYRRLIVERSPMRSSQAGH